MKKGDQQWPAKREALRQLRTHLLRQQDVLDTLLATTEEVGPDQVPEEMKAMVQQELSDFDDNVLQPFLDEYGVLDREQRGVSRVACIFPQEICEEWLGELRESRWELINAGYPWWRVSLITSGRVLLLFWSLIQMKYQDLGF